MNLGDIPDLSGVADTTSASFAEGWYKGTILEKREFTDKNGNDRVFASTDEPSASGNGRNIRLQVVVTRASDNRTFSVSHLINYQPEDLTADTVAAVTAQKDKVKDGEEWGELFRPMMSLTRLSKLQKIAGVRQLQRNGNGGLDLHSLFGKEGYFRIGPDKRNPQYTEIKDMRPDRPTKATVY